jgi:hypothetical protein
MRAFNTAVTVFIVMLVFHKHIIKAELSRLRNLIPRELRKIFNMKEFPDFMIEVMIMLSHLPPFMDEIEDI